MRRFLVTLSSAMVLSLVPGSPLRPEPAEAQAAGPVQGGTGEVDRSKLPDSFKYYGPNGLWWKWTEDQKKYGRDTWFFDTGGNQKFYRILSRFGGEHDISIDFFRLLATDPEARFRDVGLMNEPNFEGKVEDDYGFLVDKWKGDPLPGVYPEDPKVYGQPTGVIGMRKFPNPAFTAEMAASWKADRKAGVRKYFANPGKVEPPYVVGITCALCHVAFDPLNPPSDPVRPRWENLAANMGNQYLREGDLFFGAGRVVAGDARPGPKYPDDPYDTKGLDESSFLYQYGHTQQPGTSETSRFSYDFINNPNTINQIFYVGNRAPFFETAPSGRSQITNHVLKDGADSVGLLTALLRVFINIGSEGDYWADHLWNPATGQAQKPFSLEEVRLAAGLAMPKDDAQKARTAELLKAYPELGQAWKESEKRVPFLASYLASYTPYMLAEVKGPDGSPRYITKDPAQLQRGKLAFAAKCAECHSNKQPFYPMSSDADKQRYFQGLVLSDQFLPGNTLSNDVRYPFNYPGLGINAARSLATNAVDGDIWANFSSKDYKALPPIGFVTFENPIGPSGQAVTTEFNAPGGGRGYYRTAALNSMWSTAPYLHNNSVGRPPLDAQGRIDPQAITVEGRLALFEDAMDQLLNPEKRVPLIKVTSADSSLTAGLPEAERLVVSMVLGFARQAIDRTFRQVADDAFARARLPETSRPAFKGALGDLIGRVRSDLDRIPGVADIARFNRDVAAKVEGHIKDVINAKLGNEPKLADLLAQLKAQFEQVIVTKATEVVDQIQSRFKIPKGTPLNLILNLNVGKAPYALKASLIHRDDPAALAKALLDLSDCPDLVENKGHTFGSELPPDDKRALIEYLKTL